jgi:3-oxoacyl-[acyl-carrier protein] reductase
MALRSPPCYNAPRVLRSAPYREASASRKPTQSVRTMDRLLENKAAVVTGSSRGLGQVIAEALCADGAKVLVVSRALERAAAVVQRIREAGGVAEACEADITDPTQADRVLRECVAKFGSLDILVNSAGCFLWKSFIEISLEEWRESLAINLSAAFYLTQGAARIMVDQARPGAVVNLSSIHASVPDAHVVAQCSSKAGLVGLTRSAAEALRAFDIRVNAVSPGAIESSSGDRRGESPRSKVTQADIASLVVYLASDLARSITGSVFDAFGSTRTLIRA